MNIPPAIAILQQLLGPCVLLKWPLKKKWSRRLWRHLTLAHMTPEYLARLTRCNVGVSLGRASDGLCAIDLDRDDLIRLFLAANGWATHTTITRGARGCQVWVRILGTYPATTNLRFEGGHCGEWRATGSQSIVPPSIHPDTGGPYTFIQQVPVAQVAYDAIRYPGGMIGPFPVSAVITSGGAEDNNTGYLSTPEGDTGTAEGKHPPAPNPATELCSPNPSLKPVDETCSPKPSPEGVAEKRRQEASPEPVAETCSPIPSGTPAGGRGQPDYDLLVRPHFATEAGHNHDRLFRLAKAVRLAIADGYAVDPRSAFALWWKESHKFTRKGLNADTYLHEFQEALACAKEDRLSRAWRESATVQAPGAEILMDDQMRRLAALCYCLRDDKGELFLSCRAAGRLLGITHDNAIRWISALVGRIPPILAVVKLGSMSSGEATSFRYVGKTTATKPWLPPPPSNGQP